MVHALRIYHRRYFLRQLHFHGYLWEEEERFELRVRRIKETIEDLEHRLTAEREDPDEKVIVSDSTPAPRAY